MIFLQSAYVYVVVEYRRDNNYYYNQDKNEWVTNYLDATPYDDLKEIPSFSIKTGILKITTIFEDFTRFTKNDKELKSSY